MQRHVVCFFFGLPHRPWAPWGPGDFLAMFDPPTPMPHSPPPPLSAPPMLIQQLPRTYIHHADISDFNKLGVVVMNMGALGTRMEERLRAGTATTAERPAALLASLATPSFHTHEGPDQLASTAVDRGCRGHFLFTTTSKMHGVSRRVLGAIRHPHTRPWRECTSTVMYDRQGGRRFKMGFCH